MVRSKHEIDPSEFPQPVQEVIAFALSSKPVELLTDSRTQPDGERYHLIKHISDVWAFGYSDASIPDNYEERGGSHWRDVRADEIAPIYANRPDPALGCSPRSEVLKLLEGRWESLNDLMSGLDLGPETGLDSGDLCDEAVSCLYYIAAWRATMGEDSPFIADMWNAFQTGGWPFGWFGEYPEGKMVVWKPEL